MTWVVGINIAAPLLSALHNIDVNSAIRALRDDGRYLYVGSAQNGTSGESWFAVIDALDPAVMTVAGTYTGSVGSGNTVDIQQLRAVSNKSGNHVAVVGTGSSALTEGWIAIFTVATPSAPAIAGRITDVSPATDYNLSATDAVWISNHVYSVGTRIVSTDVSTPTAPVRTQTFNPVSPTSSMRGVVAAGTGYIGVSIDNAGTDNRFLMVDISNPAAMAVTGTYTFASLKIGVGMAKHPTSSLVYVAFRGDGGTGMGIAAVDISTPATPTLAWSTTVSASVYDVEVSADGTDLYAIATDRLLVFDLTTPSAPTLRYDEGLTALNAWSVTPTALALRSNAHLFVPQDINTVRSLATTF